MYQDGEWDTYDDDNWPDVSESNAATDMSETQPALTVSADPFEAQPQTTASPFEPQPSAQWQDYETGV